MPDDVRRFLVLRDEKGKTQVHEWHCEYLGNKKNSAVVVLSGWRLMLGKLKHMFEMHGRVGKWDGEKIWKSSL